MTRRTISSIHLWWLVAGCVALAGSAVAQPQDGEGPWRHRGHRGPPKIDFILEQYAERLQLEPETQQEIRRIAAASRSEGDGIRGRVRAERKELRAMLDAENPDEAEIMQKADAVGALRSEEHKNRLRALLRIRALLTPEQRAELVKIHRETRRRSGPWRDE